MTRPVRFLVMAILLSSCSESTSAPTAPRPAAPRTALVETTTGPVQGQDDGNLYTYFGIPYAAPPVGRLRWKPPQPVTPWTEALETLAPEEPVIPSAPAIIRVNKCPQTLFGGDVSAPFVGPVDEDCLYLNVVTPKAGARLPVMVWIHGGALSSGTRSCWSISSASTCNGHRSSTGISSRSSPFRPCRTVASTRFL